MAKMGSNSFMNGASGKVGNTVFRQLRGETIVSGRAKKRESNSQKQDDVVEHFTNATNFGKYVLKDPELRRQYEKKITDKMRTAYHVALADFMNAPKIIYIQGKEIYTGKPGDVIMIKAIDDFKVMSVSVQILDSKGKLIEKGAAYPYPRRPQLWLYRTTTETGKPGYQIKVVATDRPGNKTEKVVSCDTLRKKPARKKKASKAEIVRKAKSLK